MNIYNEIRQEDIQYILQAFEEFKDESDYIDYYELTDELIEEIMEEIDFKDPIELIEFFEENLVME